MAAKAAYTNERMIESVAPMPMPHSHHAMACLEANAQIHGTGRGILKAGKRVARQAWRFMGCGALFGFVEG